ncbi:MAG TPA: 1-deoxy-D-xylulose-5-phosphate reductoisomerase [Syntrophorhabdales bacterium]|nr:1-deoxy-D-xylulose-5-phosphate reductoisomerase [Syntrophorhabdales bacterium]
MKKRIVVLGSTGSIGRATLEVIEKHQDRMEVYGLACKENAELFAAQLAKWKPRYACVFDPERAREVSFGDAEELSGLAGMKEMVRTDADIIVNALPGSIGLEPTLEALKNGKTLALANKESLVMAGRLIANLASEAPARLIPVDSEHSALHQLLNCSNGAEVETLIITASGGPFRKATKEELRKVRPDDAMKHPTWKMGKKITLDSATLTNKGLEVIEAHWLFGLEHHRIKVMIHPESIVHGMVEMRDGSIFAYLAHPDMRIPISYALNEESRTELSFGKVKLATLRKLTFAVPDVERFPALKLAYEALDAGDSACIVFNGANEVAATAFMEGRIGFTDISRLIDEALTHHTRIPIIKDEHTIWEVHRWALHYVMERLRRSSD